MNVQIKHQFNVVNSPRESRSLVSKTIPNQAPELRFIINQIQNGQPVPVMEMRADRSATLDDIDLTYISQKQMTSEILDALISDLDRQETLRASEVVGKSQDFPRHEEDQAAGRQPQDVNNSVE